MMESKKSKNNKQTVDEEIKADAKALAELFYDIYQDKKNKS